MQVELASFREKVLSDCEPDKSFWTCNGTICRNIYELMNNILGLNEESFRYHVNTDHQKNDFAKWISEVLGDEELALRLQGVTDKEKYLEIIRQRIKELEEF